MPKKLPTKKKVRPSRKQNKNRLVFYLTFSMLVLAVGIVSYISTNLFFSNRTPTCANSKSCNQDLSVKIDNNVSGTFDGKKVYPPTINPSENEPQAVLGDTTAPGDKHIYVDLSTQTLTAYQGSTQILKTLVSTGKWGRTPTGDFHIWTKLRSTRMSGGEGADAYDLPNVEYVMYFYHDFGLHTAYWHDNFGHPMSHGCVNLRRVDAKALYEWADGSKGKTLGTAVSICDQITSDNKCIQNNPVQL